MRPSPKHTTSKISLAFLKLAVVVLLSCITLHSSDSDAPSLRRLGVSGHFRFDDGILHAAKDFGNRCQFMPSAVLYPKSASDISATVRHVYQMGPRSRLTVAARGHGHSLQGQAQASGGVVVMMESLWGAETRVVVRDGDDNAPYAEASGGALWINVLRDSLRYDLAPKSWTDYLRLTVGGTLSNAGVSGQAFRHGPQISNVQQLEIITGTGEMMNCSAEENTDLFFAVLGGLGQFGIITRARIALEPAPKMVRWVRVLYSDFSIFSEDQEMLIEAEDTFDYIEGFVIKNRTGLVDNWRSFLYPKDPIQASQFESEGRTLFCLEMAKNYFNPGRTNNLLVLEQEINKLLSRLRYVPSTLFQSDVPYVDFLDRVHASELKLKTKGLWDVPHPWLNLMVPRTRIRDFAAEVFGSIVADSSNGPIIVYPVNKSKWDNRTSAVFPDEEIFYMVAFLSSAPSSSDQESLARLLKQNENILDFCRNTGIAVKQYLPQHTSMDEWKSHFGHRRWGQFLRRKSLYDPFAILAPGQRIFRKDNVPVSRQLSI